MMCTMYGSNRRPSMLHSISNASKAPEDRNEMSFTDLVSSMHTAGLYRQYYPFQYRTTTSQNGCSSMNSDPPTSFLHFVATRPTFPPFPLESYTYPNFRLPWFFFLFFDLGGGGGSESILLHMIEPSPSLSDLRLSNPSSS